MMARMEMAPGFGWWDHLRSGHKLFVAYSPVVREEMVLGGVRRESL